MARPKKIVAIGSKAMTWEGFLDHLRKILWGRAGTWAGTAKDAKVTYRWIRTFIHAERCEVTISRVMRLAGALGLTVRITVDDISQCEKTH